MWSELTSEAGRKHNSSNSLDRHVDDNVKWMKVIVFLKRIDRLKKVKIKRHRRINDSKKVDWQTVKVAKELKWD